MRNPLTHPLDTRALLPVILLTGVLIWKMSLYALLALGTALFFLFLRVARTGDVLRLFRGGISLVIYWTALSALSMLLTGSSKNETLQAFLILTTRLIVILLLGSWILRRSRPQELSRGVVWFLKRIIGKKSWEIGLALTVMIRSLPDILHMIARSREAAAFRLQQSSSLRRMTIVAIHCLNRLPSTSEDVALAVTVRRLDNPSSWLDSSVVPFHDWMKASVVCIGLILLTFSL